jgi:hypothetical protein
MKDFLGNQLEVGDEVVFIVPGYRELTRGIITKFTKCFVFIEKHNPNQIRAAWQETIKQTPEQLVKINK